MRNTELINEIYAELVVSRVRDEYRGAVPDVTDNLIELIERERPELKEMTEGMGAVKWVGTIDQ